MANRYYTSFPLALGDVVLQGPEARHLATVMRARPGDAVCLFNGDGSEYLATVTTVGKRDVSLRIDSIAKPERELAFRLEVAAAVPKGDREELLIEKLTELGVTRFVPLITERSIVVPKVERLRRTVIEASKQCGRNVLMDVVDVRPLCDYLATSAAATRWLAHVSSGSLLPCRGGLGWGGEIQTRADAYPPPQPSPTGGEGEKPQPPTTVSTRAQQFDIAAVIGPEGGFTDEEVNAAIAAGWQLISLGPRILRIETAAIALAAYCSLNANNA